MLPNLITACRLGMLVPIVLLLQFGESATARRVVFALFAAAGASDWIDGWIARRFNQVSAIGTFFDPLVDKIMANVLLVFLAFHSPGWVNLWLVLLILAREFAVQGFRSMAPCKGVLIRTRMLNKWKFALQVACIAFTLAGLAWEAAAGPLHLLARAGLWLAFLTAYLSLFALLWQNKDLWTRDAVRLEER